MSTEQSGSELHREYWVVRHGERYDHVHPILFRLLNLAAKWSDSWLTDRGRKHAGALGNEIHQSSAEAPEVIVTSPYLRCVQTAHAIQNAFKRVGITVPLVIEEQIGEFQPIGIGSTYMFPEGLPGIPQFEKASQMILRARSAADSIVKRYSRAVVVSHASLVYHMSTHLLAICEPFSVRREFGRSLQVPYLGYMHCRGSGYGRSDNVESTLEIVKSTIPKLDTLCRQSSH
jgi:broad specificity phosphatase PhoE